MNRFESLESPPSQEMLHKPHVVHLEADPEWQEKVLKALHTISPYYFSYEAIGTPERMQEWTDKFKRNPIAPDLLILDEKLSLHDNETGYNLGYLIQKKHPHVSTLVLSNHPENVILPLHADEPLHCNPVDKRDITNLRSLMRVISETLNNTFEK